MPDYIVTWSIKVTAENGREAAEEALSIQRDAMSDAVVFMVESQDGWLGEIDLSAPPGKMWRKWWPSRAAREGR